MHTLYIANKNYSSWSLRPWVLMSELGIPFEEQVVAFNEGSNWEAFRRFSPNGRVPCLRNGDTVVWDSLAIAEYLAEAFPAVWPSEREARAWARCAAAEMHSGFGTLREECGMNCGLRVTLHAIGPSLRRDIDRVAELWNEGLARFGGPFLAGKTFTAVDAFFAPVAFRVQTYGLALPGAAADYAARMLALPSMQRWYAAALAERWRDEAHEREIRHYGQVREDLRAA
ncbi:glutathione S-transferase family protein [Dyella sp. ASV21]|uniref:glutathione S-transferase family protein n=1 Tax=Dyella sp. ASV21 TaxID=2795114 RepID=UPI0018EC68A6|nr:glutathione S-transferase family protein [Dyella sp. ASV21]